MAAGVTALTILVAECPTEGTAASVLRWGARLLAAALVAGGVILTVDGILAV